MQEREKKLFLLNMMKRREAILAKKEERKPRRLTTIDFLLGVYDETRMGALRFAEQEGGPFVSNDKDLATPPWTTLRKLETASLAFEKDEDGEAEKWLKQLIAPGSSLGGARPKASVLAPDNSLWIAKFPSKHDDINKGAWEMVVHDLAVLCGLNVPEAKLEDFSKAGSTFLVKRFDREGKRRIHYASAMTLLGKNDGAKAEDGSSYLELLSLNVDETNNLIDFELALAVARRYEMPENQAVEALNDIKNIVEKNWKKLAQQYGISRGEIERMSPAFDMTFK